MAGPHLEAALAAGLGRARIAPPLDPDREWRELREAAARRGMTLRRLDDGQIELQRWGLRRVLPDRWAAADFLAD